MSENQPPVFLIATVGGAPEPIATAIKHWSPKQVVFVVSADTRSSVTDDKEYQGKPSPSILTLLKKKGISDFIGRYSCFEVSNPQDYTALVRELRGLDAKVTEWRRDYQKIQLVIDFTGGTKAMSAAMALIASRWEECRISYVGGTERSKGGVGIVRDGKEKVIPVHNPWEALGYLVEEQAKTLFNHGAYAAAKRLLEPARNAVDAPRNEELNALVILCEFFELWNNFQHEAAWKKIPQIEKNWNNLALGDGSKKALKSWLSHHKEILEQLKSTSGTAGQEARTALAVDLIANAARRIEQGAFDDAVARLYRAIEALAQAWLCQHDFFETNAIPFANIPAELQEKWQSRPRDEECLKLCLQDAYELLSALGDQHGKQFAELGLNDQEKSPLTKRNQSVLAHGYQPISEKDAKQLFAKALSLVDLKREGLLVFPRI